MNKRIYWFLIALAALMIAFAPLPVGAAAPMERKLRVEASQFAFLPGEITVNPGDTVTIELVSKDVVHGFYLDGYGLTVEADPGQPGYLTFIANKSGSFRFRCNVTCGAMHPFMMGKLNVGTDTSFWRGLGLLLLSVGVAVVFVSPPISE